MTPRLAQTTKKPDTFQQGVILAKAVTKLFNEHWHLVSADQLMLLGLAENNRLALKRYASGKEQIGPSRDLRDRVGHLLGIHKSLKLLYPHNETLRRHWMSSPNDFFGGATPLTIVRQYGLPGLVMVRGRLDSMRGQ